MADPICRWRYPTAETICELVKELPKEIMPWKNFRAIMSKNQKFPTFLNNVSQLPRQLGLYYEDPDDGNYYPRFDRDITLQEAQEYFYHWMFRYYIPNPYTALKGLTSPIEFLQSFVEFAVHNPEIRELKDICSAIFNESITNVDVVNFILKKSELFDVIDNGTSHKVTLKLGYQTIMKTIKNSNDKKEFFHAFDFHEESHKTYSYQLITYGAPGTGKSHKIDEITNERNSIRVTFHPDTDYAAFVGAYKPTMCEQERYALDATGKTHKIDAKETSIVYSFVPQSFMKAYVEAWRRYTDDSLQGDVKDYYLVIEEINRGNCAQIFGDLFQLLDRADNGFSAYAISPDDDIQKFLETDKNYKLVDISLSEDIKKQTESGEKVIATAADIKMGKKIVLPPNLYIRATMNTSDQSLFPMDSAFKRRWDWKYVPIKDAGKGWKIKFGDCEVDWWKFLVAINKVVKDVTSSADKQMGYFFVKAKDSVVDAEMFVNKVAFYLWNDVFRDCELDGDAFKIEREGDEVDVLAFQDFFKEDGTINEEVLKIFLTNLVPESKPENDATTQTGAEA